MSVHREAWSRTATYAVLAVVLSLVLWSLRPAASDGFSGALRLLFWGLHVVVLLPLLYGAQSLLLRARMLSQWPGAITVIGSGIIGALAFTPIAMGIDALFEAPNDIADEGSLLQRAFEEFAGFVLPVTTVWFLINARRLLQLSVPKLKEDTPRQVPQLSGEERAFWELVPAALGHDLVALSAEQHYLRVYTSKGETLILFALGRAIAATERFNGLQVHRSHWVALAHVVELQGTRRNMKCRLTNGLTVPISRANVQTIQTAFEARRASEIAETA